MILSAPVFCLGQGEGNIWHFGFNAGIDFNSGSPVSIYSPIVTLEGTSTICDASGNLLFSTDGRTVYNSLGDTMGIGLHGHYSSTQAALIVPVPENCSKYYIFTSDELSGNAGIQYSLVDMTLNSGFGGLVSINTPLLNSACEKLTAVRNSNGIDYWVVVHAYPSNEFYSFPITSLGVGTPTITAIGLPINGIYNSIGYLKFSLNGNLIVAARNNSISDPIELFNFDATTGALYNYTPIPSTGLAYGVSFSPDDTKLYISYWNLTGNQILQYDLTQPNFENFPYVVLQNTNYQHGALQLAPDGKIYCVKGNQYPLDVINFPNLPGSSCNYIENGFNLIAGTQAWLGLPNFIDSYFSSGYDVVNLGPDLLLCENNSTLTLHAGLGFASYLWNNGSTFENIQVTDSGYYSVTATNCNGVSFFDTIHLSLPSFPNYSVNSFTDTLNCINTQAGAIDIAPIGGTGSYTYQWSNGATTQDLNNLNAGTYTVTVTDSVGCIVSDPPITIVQINDLQVNNTSFNNLKCHDDTNGFINVTVLNGLSPNNYEWSTGATTEDLNNLTAGTYSVTVSDAGGCTASDTVVITAPNQVIASLTTVADTVFCSITGGTPSYHYLWSTNATTAFIDSAINGTYTVTVSDINNCTAVATLTIDAVSTVDGDTDFEIYPNPASEELIVKSEKLFDATISVIDILGRVIQTSRHQLPTSNHLDVSNYSEGIYFIKLVSSRGITVVQKFVVVH